MYLSESLELLQSEADTASATSARPLFRCKGRYPFLPYVTGNSISEFHLGFMIVLADGKGRRSGRGA